mgnify:CR=1 FL=1
MLLKSYTGIFDLFPCSVVRQEEGFIFLRDKSMPGSSFYTLLLPIIKRLSLPKVIGMSVSEYDFPLVSNIQEKANNNTFLTS